MDDLFSLHSGLFLRREALSFGYTDRELAHAVRAGVLAKVRHGAYVDKDTLDIRKIEGKQYVPPTLRA